MNDLPQVPGTAAEVKEPHVAEVTSPVVVEAPPLAEASPPVVEAVTPAPAAEDVSAARQQGATDLEIHDTVLIAALFCMCNRYVDGLGTWAPEDPSIYRERAAEIVEHGYSGVTEAATALVQR